MDEMEMMKRKVSEAGQVVIYGAGAVANIAYHYIRQAGFGNRVAAFAVSDMRGNPRFMNGLPVARAEELLASDRHVLVVAAVQKPTQREIADRLEGLKIDSYLLVDPDKLIDSFYQPLYQEPVIKNKLFFMNYNGCGYGCNPKYIAEYLRKNYGKRRLDMVWGVDGSRHAVPGDIRTVRIGTLQYYKEIATSHIWIDNVRKQADIRKREGQFYIQTWHGAAPMKKVEGNIADKVPQSHINAGKRDSEMADLFLSGSRFYSGLYRKAFWYDGEIMESGLPRQDIFWDIKYAKRKVKEYYHIDKAARIVLYAPTFRDDFNDDAYDLDILAVTDAIEKKFACKCVMCVGKHPNNRDVRYGFDPRRHIDVSGYDDFEEVLAAADFLITDFSGCSYDFSLTGNPVFLYQKDYRKMAEQRDFYVPMDELPYPKARSNAQLIENIFHFDQTAYGRNLKKYMDRFGNYDDGHAAERVCERIMGMLDE